MVKKILKSVLITAGILMVPLTAMQFSSEVNWGIEDFIVIGILVFGTSLVHEFVIEKIKNRSYRMYCTLGLLAVFMLMWVDLAVGIFNIPGISGN